MHVPMYVSYVNDSCPKPNCVYENFINWQIPFDFKAKTGGYCSQSIP